MEVLFLLPRLKRWWAHPTIRWKPKDHLTVVKVARD
jgi:hypothetical protein